MSQLSQFQSDYVKKHSKITVVSFKTQIFQWLVILVMTSIAFGIFASITYPEDVSKPILNFISFSSLITVIAHILMTFVLCIVILMLGGVGLIKAAAIKAGGEDKDAVEALTMKMYRQQLTYNSMSFKIQIFFANVATFALLLAFIANGWTFYAIVILLSKIASYSFSRINKSSKESHLQSLTPERVEQLDAMLEEMEEKKKKETEQLENLKRGLKRVESYAGGNHTFAYEAMDATGTEIKDTILASSQEEASSKIRLKGFFVTKINRLTDTNN